MTYSRQELAKMPLCRSVPLLIADGNWYNLKTITKNLRSDRVDEITDVLEDLVKTGWLVKRYTNHWNYRLPGNKMPEYFSHYGLTLGVQPTQASFTPNLYNGMTEADGVEGVPVYSSSCVRFNCDDADDLNRVKQATLGWGRMIEGDKNRYTIYCLAGELVKQKVKDLNLKHVTKLGTAKLVRRVELCDYNQDWVAGVVTYYSKYYKNFGKSGLKVLQYFLPEPEQQRSQFIAWVLTALQTFDNRLCIPFGGYLNVYLSRCVFQLPGLTMHSRLATYQRARNKCIKTVGEVNPEWLVENTSLKTVEQVNELEKEHQQWLQLFHCGSLSFSTTDNEDVVLGVLNQSVELEPENVPDRDWEVNLKLCLAALQALEATNDKVSFRRFIDLLNKGDELGMKGLSEDFLIELKKNLQEEQV